MAKNPPARSSATQRRAPPAPPTLPSKELQVFANPAPQRDYVIEFEVPEFTCNCPLTGQPDFAQFHIEMIADKLCVELKSLKLYLQQFRNEGIFYEHVTNRILDDLVAAIAPRRMQLRAAFTARGGITTTVIVEHQGIGERSA